MPNLNSRRQVRNSCQVFKGSSSLHCTLQILSDVQSFMKYILQAVESYFETNPNVDICQGTYLTDYPYPLTILAVACCPDPLEPVKLLSKCFWLPHCFQQLNNVV